MNVATRGMRNAFRNATRTLSIVFILGLTIGLSLVMLIANQAVDNKIKQTMGSIGNTVSIHPAGFSNGSSVNNALTSAQLKKIGALRHVKNVLELLDGHAQTEGTSNQPNPGAATAGPESGSSITTSLKSPYKLNCDKGSCSGGGVALGTNGGAPALPSNFSLPISFIGANQSTNPLAIGATSLKIVSGHAIQGTKDSNDAMISSAMAKKNNLKVGSTFTAYGKTLRVAAIFKSDTQGGNSTVVVSLPALQRLADEKNVVTGATATVDSLDNLSSVTAAIKKSLKSTADVTSSLDQANQAIQPLKSVRSISLYSLIGAVSASAVIILLTMIMIVRERKREIGVLKAIGCSNVRIVSQFMCEALTLTVLGTLIGLVVGVIGGNPVTSSLINNSNHTPGSGGPGQMVQGLNSPASEAIKNIHAAVSWSILLYGFGAAILIALVGSALAASLISKVRPSEVLRSE